MRVAAIITQAQAARVEHAVSPTGSVSRVLTWRALIGEIAKADMDVVMVNPAFVHPILSSNDQRRSAVAQLHRIPLLLYVRLEDLRLALSFVRDGALDILVDGHTDSYSEIRQSVLCAASSSAELILRGVVGGMAGMDARIIRLVEHVFRHPEQFQAVATLSRTTAVAERTMYRMLSTSGLVPVSAIVRVAQAARAFDLVRTRKLTLDAAARALNYSSSRQLSTHLRYVTNLSSASASTTIPQAQFVNAALRRLLRQTSVRTSPSEGSLDQPRSHKLSGERT